MRNPFALFPFLLILFSACNSNSVSEETLELEENMRWESGQFYYTDSLFGNFLIRRYDSLQLEYLQMHQLEVQFKMDWLNDSAYTLSFDKINQNPNNISLPHDIDSLIKTCTMSNFTDSSYIERATSNLNRDTILTTIYLVKK